MQAPPASFEATWDRGISAGGAASADTTRAGASSAYQDYTTQQAAAAAGGGGGGAQTLPAYSKLPAASPPFSASPRQPPAQAAMGAAARDPRHESSGSPLRPMPGLDGLDDVQLSPPGSTLGNGRAAKLSRSRQAMRWAPRDITFPDAAPTILRKRQRVACAAQDWTSFLHARADKRKEELEEAQGADELYYVERILESRKIGSELLVKWKGYDEADSTWELRTSLATEPGVNRLIAEFDVKHVGAFQQASAPVAKRSPAKRQRSPAAATARQLDHRNQGARLGELLSADAAVASGTDHRGWALAPQFPGESPGGVSRWGASPRTMDAASMLIQGDPAQQQQQQQPQPQPQQQPQPQPQPQQQQPQRQV